MTGELLMTYAQVRAFGEITKLWTQFSGAPLVISLIVPVLLRSKVRVGRVREIENGEKD